MASYKTPGVYVEEVSTLPPSVAEVSTAIPAFIGYTEKGSEVAKIQSMLEFESIFGGPQMAAYSVATRNESGNFVIDSIAFSESGKPTFFLYYALMHYFRNGGGACYVVSIGNYTTDDTATALSKAHFLSGLDRVKVEDEPTLLVFPEAVSLTPANYNAVCQQALAQCGELKDRFTILDVRDGEGGEAADVTAFRSGIGTNALSYGAAYHPYLVTTLSYRYNESDVSVDLGGDGDAPNLGDDTVKVSQTALYNQIKAELAKQTVILPPSAAIAGIYARVDRQRGVWKAPANVSLASVIQPSEKITNSIQDDLNVDPTAGKSINAIRAFTGKGVLVWGARTLAGNDNEWRYVSVRRLFVMIEESIQKSTGFAVFESNDATTWLKVKGMIEGYLYGLWEKGALQGSIPEQAYYVHVGLGKTMTQQDVLEGRLIVEVGIAAVRPAEFIILRFMHKLPEA
jgi:phage tail sheath protein FI